MAQAPQFYPAMQGMQYAPPPPPQVNAVKIDIINPQAYGAPSASPQGTTPQNNGYYYQYPTAQTYGMPTNPYYSAPQATAMPPVQQVPIQQPPSPMVPPAPNYQVPTPAPIVNSPIPPAVVDQTVTPAAVPVAAPDQPPALASNALDATALVNDLNSSDLDKQTAAIQKIAETAQVEPEKAKSLLNEQTFQSLVNIITKDSSKLPGPETMPKPAAGQPEVNPTLSPLEKAEINKQIGTYTLAVLQKIFRNEFDKEIAAKPGTEPISILELPGIRQIVVDNLKNNPNPTIREASISAINYVAKPEDPKERGILRELFKVTAEQDADPNVKAAATASLENLNKFEQEAPKAAPAK
jgi:hypothetical protein